MVLFEDLAETIRHSLADLADWGLSGIRPTQYHHDVVADDIVVPRLTAAGYSILTEESGLVEASNEAPGSGVTVVVDPVDGSTNASRGLPWYATSLCAVDADGPAVSLVVNLASGTRYRAIRGEGMEVVPGANGDESSRAVSPGPSSCTRIDEAVIGVSGWPPSHGGWRQYRSLGAAALDICAVATGGLDGYLDVDRAHGVWDYLGAALVCREAGAVIVDADRDELVVLDPQQRRAPVAAAPDELLSQLLDLTARWASESNRS